MRRQPAEPGHRPRAGVRFAAGTCRACRAPYILDRQAQPWARARTCSAACAKVVANRGRTPSSCRHCAMVLDWRLAVDAHLKRHDTAARDEDARPPTFGQWLRAWEYEHDGPSDADREAGQADRGPEDLLRAAG